MDQDAFSENKYLLWRPGQRKAAKRRANRRERREERQQKRETMNVLEGYYVKSNGGDMVLAPGFPEKAYAALAAVLATGDERVIDVVLRELQR